MNYYYLPTDRGRTGGSEKGNHANRDDQIQIGWSALEDENHLQLPPDNLCIVCLQGVRRVEFEYEFRQTAPREANTCCVLYNYILG